MRVLAAFLINALFNFVVGLLIAKFLGPENFGRFALAMATSVLAQTLAFEWIRLAAVRLYSERSRSENPALRATLDLAFALLAGALAIAAIALLASGLEAPPASALVALAVAVAIGNGLFDYHAALVRARFLDRLYARLVLGKNVLALVLTVGAAWWWASPAMALAGACLAMFGSVLLTWRPIRDPDAPFSAARRPLAIDVARYALPIVAANTFYVAIPLINRAWVTADYGFAATGHFSLAFDIGGRLMAALGTALDVLLFQLAVREEAERGREAAQAQVARNAAVVFALLAPAAAGLWLVLPSAEALFAPVEYRGPFGVYLALMLPGLFFAAMNNYAVNAVFQIDKRTSPLIAAALTAVLANVAFALLLPRGADAGALALAQSLAFAVAFGVLVLFAARAGAHMPAPRDLTFAAGAVALMVVVVAPLRLWEPGVTTLALQAAAGLVVYGGLVMLLDIAGLRTTASQAVKMLRRRV